MRNLLAIVLTFFCLASYADELLPIPHLTGGYVIDQSNVLSKTSIDEINKVINGMDKVKGTAVMGVFVLPSTKGEPIEQFSLRTAEAWKLGHSGHEDGIVLVIATNDHKSRLEVGRGISGDLSDVVARGVLSKVNPDFKAGKFSVGILNIINDVNTIVKPQALITTIEQKKPTEVNLGLILAIVILGGAISVLGYYFWRKSVEDARREEELRLINERRQEEMMKRAQQVQQQRQAIKTSMLGKDAGPARVPFPYKLEPGEVVAATVGVAAGVTLADRLRKEAADRLRKEAADRQALERVMQKRRDDEEEAARKKKRDEESDSTDSLISGIIGLGVGLALGGGSSSSRDDSPSPSYSPSTDDSSSSSSSYDGGGGSSSFD
jgi:uncharacterized membrane protein YgcG